MKLYKEYIQKNVSELKNLIYHMPYKSMKIKYKEGHYKSPAEAEAAGDGWLCFQNGGTWGKDEGRYWFSIEAFLPEEYEKKAIMMHVATGREGLWDTINPQFLVYKNDEIIHALDVNHREILISDSYEQKPFIIGLDAYFGRQNSVEKWDMTGILDITLYCYEKAIEDLYYDLRVPLDALDILDKASLEYSKTLMHLKEACDFLDFRKPYSKEFFDSISKASAYIKTEFYEKYCKENFSSQPIFHSIGHGHIDIAWGWTIKESRDKIARTTSNVLYNMKNYTQALYIQSQPKLYTFLKEDYPDIYAKVKQRIKEGLWEAEGAMWVEADCNLTSGEGLARQLLYGKRFFKEELGVDCKILWLPDVFGYSGALPQILKKAGVDYFMTTKLAGNEFNKISYDLFDWQGIDGTKIFTHIPRCYNGLNYPWYYKEQWDAVTEKEITNEVLNPYGYGDGGGGPTKEMLEYAKRMEIGIPGVPKFEKGKVIEFFEKKDAQFADRTELPVWTGELYFEYHRGTYTGVGKIKRANRKNEINMLVTEFLIAAALVSGAKIEYKDELFEAWEKVLTNHFHDILPGSSIKEVYDVAMQDYEKAAHIANALQKTALEAITSNLANTVINPSPFTRNILVGDSLVEDVPAYGAKLVEDSSKDFGKIIADTKRVSTPYYDITFDENMDITSIYDKCAQREVLKHGERANQFQNFEDDPVAFSSWNIDIYYSEKQRTDTKLVGASITFQNKYKTVITVEKRLLESTIWQDIILYTFNPRIDFVTRVDWKQRKVLLKVAFPVDIAATNATYDIQYGNLERPTHYNTSYDLAKFEVCAHKWADISEDNYGVSLMNDCKYGYDIHDSTMRLTLIKSSGGWPYPEADNELHEFTYSLYPHVGNWKRAHTIEEAYDLNYPSYQVPYALPMLSSSLVSSSCDNVIIESIKPALDGNGIIVRVYESKNRRSKCKLHFSFPIPSIEEVSLIEESIGEQGDLYLEGHEATFTIRPYEIKSFRLGKVIK